MMACYRSKLRLAALSIAACSVDGFVNNQLRSSFSAALPKFYQVSELPASVSLRMSSSFPEDTDLGPSSLSNNERVDPLPKSSSNFTSSSERFAKEFDRRRIEFALDDDTEETPVNTETTLRNEVKSEIRFKSGDALIDLRRRVAELRADLEDAKDYCDSIQSYAAKDQLAAKKRVRQLETTISTLVLEDAEFCYVFMTEVAARAEKEGDADNVKRAKLEAAEARSCIPQLNMHGLWVGKYGEHGYEMVNITYVGDTLFAKKVTGDQNVPRGEISFTCNLSPRLQFQPSSLEPIELNAKSSRQWGKRYLPRYAGQGQVASEGYRNAQWMDGQLILVGKFFSFAWVPIGHQVFFGRPTPELVIKMFKEQEKEEMKKDPAAKMRKVAEAMMDETYWSELERDFFSEEGCFE